MKFIAKSLLVSFCLGMVVFCWIVSFRLPPESTLTLVIFSFLFGATIFQLNGSVIKKVGLMTGGEVVGLFWNLVFDRFASIGYDAFGEVFDEFYVLVFPFLNMIWIVTYWSLSMSFFYRSRTGRTGGSLNDY